MDSQKRVLNKLVRDGIPGIIAQHGGKSETRIAEDDKEYDTLLRAKLLEEAEEIAETTTREALLEELADLNSVRDALCTLYNISVEELLVQQRKKDNENGKFEKRILLISAEN